jgi:hypothetical protein
LGTRTQGADTKTGYEDAYNGGFWDFDVFAVALDKAGGPDESLDAGVAAAAARFEVIGRTTGDVLPIDVGACRG